MTTAGPSASVLTIGSAARNAAARHPGGHVVVVSDERPYRSTIGMLGCDALSRAAWLQSIGIGRGDVVALQLPNWYEGLVIQAATFLVGATVLPIVPIYGPREVEFILRDSGATVVVLAAQVKGRLVASALIEAGAVKSVGTVVVVGDDIPSGAIGWEDTAADWREGEDPAEPDDIALLVYTSGTTSDPKGVKHTHRSLIADTLSPVVADGAGPDSSHLSVFPSGHVAAANGLLRILIHATPTVLMDVWNPVQAAELIDEYAVTSTAGAPIHLSGLLDAQERGEVALATLRGYLVGGASVPAALVERADAAGIAAFRAYGLSEHPTIAGGSPDDPIGKRTHTDGRIQPGNEVRIVDDLGRDVAPGIDGEILSRGTELFAGYLRSELTAEAFTDDGWFRTGDVGNVDRDGYLTVTDRKKDIIVRGGENISSREVEDVVSTHPKVSEVAAVGAPDPVYGERVAVFVVLREGAERLNIDEVGEHFRLAGVARQKTPEVIRTVSTLPRTAAGKVQKAPLRQQLRAGTNQSIHLTD